MQFPYPRLDPFFLQQFESIGFVHTLSRRGSLNPAGQEELVREVCTPFHKCGTDAFMLMEWRNKEDVEDFPYC